jgi:predicted transcriptional regulator
MRKIKIKPEILSLLTSKNFHSFKTADLIDAYMSIPECALLSKRQAQQFIKRNIDRLEWAGLIAKGEGDESLTYHITEKFHSGNYSIGSPHCNPIEIDTTQTKKTSDDMIANDLNELLSKHKLELLTTISEAEEYETLSKQLPNRRSEIQELYNDARNRYSKTLGRVKAIESLISISQAS